MTKSIRISVYVVLALLTILFGCLTYRQYDRLMSRKSDRFEGAAVEGVPATEQKPNTSATPGYGTLFAYIFLFGSSVVGLGLLIGHDISHSVVRRMRGGGFDDEPNETSKSTEYEIAEQEWADGHFLESIRLMREYLRKNSSEQHVAIRIAEIYEKDLQNPLAAALEYEEILKTKLESERWGWAAIHLCNLYFKLDQSDKAVALLHRIVNEYGETAAAGKARKRLAKDEPGNAGPAEESSESDEKPA